MNHRRGGGPPQGSGRSGRSRQGRACRPRDRGSSRPFHAQRLGRASTPRVPLLDGEESGRPPFGFAGRGGNCVVGLQSARLRPLATMRRKGTRRHGQEELAGHRSGPRSGVEGCTGGADAEAEGASGGAAPARRQPVEVSSLRRGVHGLRLRAAASGESWTPGANKTFLVCNVPRIRTARHVGLSHAPHTVIRFPSCVCSSRKTRSSQLLPSRMSKMTRCPITVPDRSM